MVTKEELLEEKTVKELKQMARDKSLSGYSKKRKDELVEVIKENYLWDEIKRWPELDLEEIGGEIEKAEETEEPEKEPPIEEVKVDRIFGMRRDLFYILTVVGAAIAGIITVLALYFHFT